MLCAPFRILLTLIVSDSGSDFPQHLLIDAADRRAQGTGSLSGIKIKDAHKIFMFKIVVRVQPASGKQRVGNADFRCVSECHSDVELIILLQERILKDVENIPLIILPIFPYKLGGNRFKLFQEISTGRDAIIALQHGRHSFCVFLPQLPQI